MKKIKKFLLRLLGSLIASTDKIKHASVNAYAKKMFAECGDNVSIGRNCEFTHGNVYLGSNVFIGSNCSFISTRAKIHVKDNVLFGPHVFIIGGNHRIDIVGKYMIDISEDEKLPENDQDIIIEEDVWIGSNVMILKGVTVGRGSVIGAGSVVVKDIPPYTVRVGTHGIYTTPRFTPEQILEHEKLIRTESAKDKK